MGGGLYQLRRLAPGDALALGIDLAQYVAFERPGPHRVRVVYTEDSFQVDEDLRGRVVFTSPELVVTIEP
jgi:hypothetical protein